MNKNAYFSGIIFSLGSCLTLGLMGLVDKIGILKSGNPLIFSVQNLFFSLLFTSLFTLLYFRGFPVQNIKKISLYSWILIILVGLFASGINILLRFVGLTQSTGTFASLSQIIITTLTILLAWIFLKEKLSKTFWLLFLIIILSTYFVSIGKIALNNVILGDFLIILGTPFVAASNMFARIVVKRESPILLSLGRFLFGFLFVLIVSFATAGKQIFNFSTYWVILSGLLWTASVINYNFAIQKIGVTLATTFLLLGPIITMILESATLNYHFTSVQIIAALVVVSSGILIIVANRNLKLS